MSMLFNLAASFMNFMGSPMGQMAAGYQDYSNKDHPYHWVYTLCTTLDSFLTPILILVGTAGLIYAVVLGVNLARADSADKQQEAKKRLVYAIIGLAVILLLILFMRIFINNADKILGLVDPYTTT